MIEEKQIVIKLSKQKLTLMFIGSLIFVGLGLLFIIYPTKFKSSIFYSYSIIFIVGLLSILFFGSVVFFIFKKLNDKKPGLIITENGIIDNSSGVAAGQIFWNDVSAIKIVEIFNQKFLMFIVDNPDQYINRQTNPIKRKAMEVNFKHFGSPISISSNGLICNFQELKNIVEKSFGNFKTKKQSI